MKTQAALELFLRYRSTSVSPTTLYTDTSILMQFSAWVGDLDIKHVTSETIRNYIQQTYEECRKHTSNRRVVVQQMPHRVDNYHGAHTTQRAQPRQC